MEIEFISTLWGIWIHRNEIIFKNINLNPGRIMEIIKENIRCAKTKRPQRENQTEKELEERAKELKWIVGQKRSSNVQTLVVDGAWKKNVK